MDCSKRARALRTALHSVAGSGLSHDLMILSTAVFVVRGFGRPRGMIVLASGCSGPKEAVQRMAILSFIGSNNVTRNLVSSQLAISVAGDAKSLSSIKGLHPSARRRRLTSCQQ